MPDRVAPLERHDYEPDQAKALYEILRRNATYGNGRPPAPVTIQRERYGDGMVGWLVEVDRGGAVTGNCSSYLIDAVGTILVPDDDLGEWVPERRPR